MQNTFTPKQVKAMTRRACANVGVDPRHSLLVYGDIVRQIHKILMERKYPDLGLDGTLEELAIKQMESASTGSRIL